MYCYDFVCTLMYFANLKTIFKYFHNNIQWKKNGCENFMPLKTNLCIKFQDYEGFLLFLKITNTKAV